MTHTRTHTYNVTYTHMHSCTLSWQCTTQMAIDKTNISS